MSLLRNATVAATALSIVASAYAAEIKFEADVPGAFNFQRDSQATLGMIKQLQIGTTVIAADFQLTNPVGEAKASAVGVLESYAWSGARTDPMDLSFYVSTSNAMKLRLLLKNKIADTTVKVSFAVAQYDPKAKVYFEALTPAQAPVTGNIATVEGALKLEVATVAGEVKAPQNYKVTLRVAAPSTSAVQQSVKYSTAKDMTVAKAWGPGAVAATPPANRSNPLQSGNTE